MRAFATGVGVLLVLLAAGAWWWLAPGSERDVPAAAIAVRDAEPPREHEATEPPSVDEVPDVGPDRMAESHPGDRGSAAGLAILRGRVLDARDEAPMAGVQVEFGGWTRNAEALDAWTKDHGEIEWQNPEALVTGADGRFELRFDPPPPYQFTMSLRRPGFVDAQGRWTEFERGQVMDLGDVRMQGGTRISGRVLDTDGVGQAEVRVSLSRYDLAAFDSEALTHRSSFHATTAQDGSFTFANLVLAGTWSVRVRDRQKVSPDEFEVSADGATPSLEIRVRSLDEIETITGVVVDDAGQPVHRARIDYSPQNRRGSRSINSSARDGGFVIERYPEDPREPVQIEVSRRGYEFLQTTDRFAWGSEDLRLVLPRGLGVDLRVEDRDSGEPVEEYGVRCFPLPGSVSRRTSTDYEVRQRGTHADGRCTLTGLTRGSRLLLVEPNGARHAHSGFVRFELSDRLAPALVVPVAPPAERRLSVTTQDGAPVVGTKVELVMPLAEHPVSVQTTVKPLSRLMSFSGDDGALLIHEGLTDASGELLLRGPVTGELALRVLGPGHAAQILPLVDLELPETLVVVVTSGCRVIGRVLPLELLRQLGPQGPTRKPRPDDEIELLEWRRTYLPGLAFTRPDFSETFPARYWDERFVLGDDGSFDIRGVPSGEWDVHLHYSVERGNSRSGSSEPVARVDLVEGEVEELDLDLSHLLMSRVVARVILNGEPMTEGSVMLQGSRPGPDGEERPLSAMSEELGEDGIHESLVLPGTYRMSVSPPEADPSQWLLFPAEETYSVEPGEERELLFHVSTGSLRLRALNSRDEPIGGATLELRVADGSWGLQLPPTDDEGWVAAPMLPARELEAVVVPLPWTTREGRAEFHRTHSGERHAWRDAMVRLGSVTVRRGAPADEVVLRVPVQAGYEDAP